MTAAHSDLRFDTHDVIVLGVLSTAGFVFTGDSIAALSMGVLWFIWRYLRHEGGAPVLAAALSFQWMQVTIGIWYFAATGRRLDTMEVSDYRPMVLIGLGCIVALACGLLAGIRLLRRLQHNDGAVRRDVLVTIGWPGLIVSYIVGFMAQGVLQRVAYEVPGLTQPILAMRFIRLAILFLILRRLSRPVLRWQWIAVLIVIEVALGLTGFFAGFREPLVMAAIALYEAFDTRKVLHWVTAAAVAATMAVLSVMWMNVRGEYRGSFDDESFAQSREARLDKIADLATAWWTEEHDPADVDRLVDRLWVVYYPALAVARVPSVLPYTDGALMEGALQHVFSPRVFFPTKAELQSDSDMVRKYSGVYVAGAEQNTSIAFGYAAESYIDYGLPLMFIAPFLFALMMGVAFEYLATHIDHSELRAGLLAVIFWLSLYLFERSWVKTLGLAGTLLIYLGGPALLLDYYLSRWDARRGTTTVDAVSEPESVWQ